MCWRDQEKDMIPIRQNSTKTGFTIPYRQRNACKKILSNKSKIITDRTSRTPIKHRKCIVKIWFKDGRFY